MAKTPVSALDITKRQTGLKTEWKTEQKMDWLWRLDWYDLQNNIYSPDNFATKCITKLHISVFTFGGTFLIQIQIQIQSLLYLL